MSRPIQIRDVPDDVHEALVVKARQEGLSLSAYVRRLLEREATWSA
jgi:predicted HicB family RNase H-like nuclease